MSVQQYFYKAHIVRDVGIQDILLTGIIDKPEGLIVMGDLKSAIYDDSMDDELRGRRDDMGWIEIIIDTITKL